MSVERIKQTTSLDNGGILHELILNGYQTFVYMPPTDLPVNLINYGFQSPTLLVFPDRRVNGADIPAYAEETGIDAVAKKNGCGVIIMNPLKGGDWSEAAAGAYEALTANLGIAQSNFRDGLVILQNPMASDEVRYSILGSTLRMCIYGFGTGADYLAVNYLKKVEGASMLGDLGKAEITPVCCTLVNGNVLPKPEKNDIHVVSVGNSEEYNAILKEFCLGVCEEASFDAQKQFREVIGAYRRWTGKICPAYNYDAENIAEVAESFMVPVSKYNPLNSRMRMMRGEKKHKVGYVTFYDKDLDVHSGKHPLMLVFHGGGDCAYATVSLAEWPEIGQEEGFITVAVEMHLQVTAEEVDALIDHLLEEYAIDPEKIYATGFSMGGIKSWDLFEQRPKRFAALLPMDAIDYVGNNCEGGKTKEEDINQDEMVPLFFIGGVDSFGVELPMHHERAIQRLQYLAKVNKLKKKFDITLEEKDSWEDPLYGIKGDRTEILHDDEHPDSVYYLHYFDSEDGKCYTALMGVTHHAHEIRPFTNRLAWNIVKKFSRKADGSITIDE